jgi:hypothetical protein
MAQSIDQQSTPNALVRAYPWLAVLTGIVILIQAFMAGRFLYGLSDLVEEHGLVGNLTFLLVILLIIGAWLGRPSGVTTNVDLILSVVLLGLVAGQLGLGYSASRSASALHIANGVLITGLTMALAGIGLGRRSARR